ncbi:hypothetical protein ACNO5E_21295 [Vibrio parahaemolyticus]|uniref:hypothetical protein n=1 Tax=Vibrio parahaemolyticus TaxID=670 RepID=UPI0008131A96|nr:hypothetical protein [Vibrio parahaemolyticus]OCP68367.1 hypothetical protein AKH08_16265 [Vibrio parahaemolyticus]
MTKNNTLATFILAMVAVVGCILFMSSYLQGTFDVPREVATDGAINGSWALLVAFVWAFPTFSIARVFYATPAIIAWSLYPVAVTGYGFNSGFMNMVVVASMILSWYLDHRFNN